MVRVYLAVYDLSRGLAGMMSQQILGERIEGIWHTGIVIYSREYFFGGGIQSAPQGHFSASQNIPILRMEDMGESSKTQSELEAFLRSVQHRFTQQTYNLMTHNCNNFSNEVCMFLTGRGIPSYIIDLPSRVFSTPGGQALRPLFESMQASVSGMSGNVLGADPFAHFNQGGSFSSSTTSSSTSASTNGLGADPFAHFNQGGSFSSSTTSSSTSASTNGSGYGVESSTSFSMGALGQASAAVSATGNGLRYSASVNSPLYSGSVGTPSFSQHIPPTAPSPSPPPTVQLEEQPLLSIDASAVSLLGNKIIRAAALTESDKELMERIVAALSATPLSLDSAAVQEITVNGTFSLLERIYSTVPACQMAALFLARLCVTASLLPEGASFLISSLCASLQAYNPAAASTAGLQTKPAVVMALCTIANWLNHYRHELIEDAVVDAAVRMLGAELPVEVRQIAAALCYNITLHSTKGGRVGAHWLEQGGVEQVHPHAVQLLCSALDGIDADKDPSCRRRRISTALRILTAYQSSSGSNPSVDLARDIGFGASCLELQRMHVGRSMVGDNADHKQETALLASVCHLLK